MWWIKKVLGGVDSAPHSPHRLRTWFRLPQTPTSRHLCLLNVLVTCTMVRIKHRYLLVHILYPEAPSPSSSTDVNSKGGIPYTVQFHQPTPDRIDARSLTQTIRNGISELFGDYGSGMTGASLQSKKRKQSNFLTSCRSYHAFHSQILLPSNKHSNHSHITRPLSSRLGSSDVHVAIAETFEPVMRVSGGEGIWND
jgi:RNase P/RNase MRP subunit POP5